MTCRERFRCNVDCKNDGANCIAERLFKETADAMVAGGYREAGYQYVNIDDCWMAHDSVAGNVTANKTRFPSGMKSLSEYMHQRHLKMGIYTAISEYTCAYSDNQPIHTLGGPGLGCGKRQLEADGCASMRRNIENLVSFGIDHLKVDGCWRSNESDLYVPYVNRSYTIASQALMEATNATGRPVVYHPSGWSEIPPYQFEQLVEHANQWRHWRDICDDGECWAGSGGVSKIIEYWAADPRTICKLKGYDPAPMCESGNVQDLENYRRRFLNAARPGAYNDPGEIHTVARMPVAAIPLLGETDNLRHLCMRLMCNGGLCLR